MCFSKSCNPFQYQNNAITTYKHQHLKVLYPEIYIIYNYMISEYTCICTYHIVSIKYINTYKYQNMSQNINQNHPFQVFPFQSSSFPSPFHPEALRELYSSTIQERSSQFNPTFLTSDISRVFTHQFSRSFLMGLSFKRKRSALDMKDDRYTPEDERLEHVLMEVWKIDHFPF